MDRKCYALVALTVAWLPLNHGWAATQGGSQSGQSVLDKATTACAQSVQGNTLDQVCTSGLCSAAAAGSGASNAEYGRLGALIASYVSKYGKNAPASADAIQACVVAGPAVLVAAFQNALGGDVAAIGQATDASPQ